MRPIAEGLVIDHQGTRSGGFMPFCLSVSQTSLEGAKETDSAAACKGGEKNKYLTGSMKRVCISCIDVFLVDILPTPRK